MKKANRLARLYFLVLPKLLGRENVRPAAALKETELQRQRTAADKKLQQAIAREEKAREAIEKKARKATERAAAREELAREKAARQAEKEVKKV
jgi:hypothetical protein